MLKSKKAFQNFREALKEGKLKVRVQKKRDERWEISIKGRIYDETIYIERNDDKTYTFHMTRSFEKKPEVRKSFLKLAKEIALQEGAPAVFIRNSPEEKEAATELGFEQLNYELNSAFLMMYSLNEVVYYYNNIPLYVENKVGIIKKMKELTIEITDLDPKRMFKQNQSRGANLNAHYYFAGVEGEIIISYAELLFSDGEFCRNFQKIDELKNIMDEHTQWVEKKTRLKNLYDPPKKHLKTFVSKAFSNSDPIAERVFSFLSKHFTPDEIEDRIVKHEPLKRVRIDGDLTMALICGFHFSFIDTEVRMYTDLDVLIQECRNKALVNAREKYEKHLKNIEKRIEEIKEKKS